MSETKPPDPDAEREVDLRSAWTRITARWYLPVAGLLIGAILGVLASRRRRRGLPRPHAALPRAALHDLRRRPDPEPRDEPEDGEPDHPLRGGAAPGRRGDSGLTLGQLRGNVTSAAVVSAGQGKNVSPLVEITVDAPRRAKAREGGGLARRTPSSTSSRPTSTRRSRSSTGRSRRAGPSSPTSTSASRPPSRSSRR